MAQAQISDLRQTAGTLRKQIPGDSATAVAREDRAESRKSVQELSAMEREAEELLKRVREEKNAALKQKTRGKKSRRRLQRTAVRSAARTPPRHPTRRGPHAPAPLAGQRRRPTQLAEHVLTARAAGAPGDAGVSQSCTFAAPPRARAHASAHARTTR